MIVLTTPIFAIETENERNPMTTPNIVVDDTYPGCPYCEQKSFVKCGGSLFSRCNKVSCGGEQDTHTCPWCGTKAQISCYIENLSAGKDL